MYILLLGSFFGRMANEVWQPDYVNMRDAVIVSDVWNIYLLRSLHLIMKSPLFTDPVT